MNKSIIATSLLALSLAVTAQEKPKTFRLGINTGLPNLVSGQLEILTPLLGHRIAPFVEYGQLSRQIDNYNGSFKALELGSNIYFSEAGRGWYVGLSYSKINFNANATDIEYTSPENLTVKGDGYTELDLDSYNVKLGVKVGRTFFFRWEIGWGFANIPKELIVQSPQMPEYTYKEDLSFIRDLGGIPHFKLGLGYAF